jgi:myo-inositol 2-dehydrogenase/D-chiro-inositol 1-dehydrogenase
MIGIGLVGAGVMGATHAHLIDDAVPEARVLAVADLERPRAERLAAELSNRVIVADALEVVHDPNVDAIIVASSLDSHERLVLACLEAGKPVLCEKPLARTAAGAERIAQAEAAHEKQLVQVGFMRRFDAQYQDLQSKLISGAIGAPLTAHCTHRCPGVPSEFDSVTMLRDAACHDVDTIRWLLGQEITQVHAYAGRSTPRVTAGVRDPQVAVLRTNDDVIVTMELYLNAHGYDIRCAVSGEDGALELPGHHNAVWYRLGEKVSDLPMGYQDRFHAAYVSELKAWVAGVNGVPYTGAGVADGAAACAVVDALILSAASGEAADVRAEVSYRDSDDHWT